MTNRVFFWTSWVLSWSWLVWDLRVMMCPGMTDLEYVSDWSWCWSWSWLPLLFLSLRNVLMLLSKATFFGKASPRGEQYSFFSGFLVPWALLSYTLALFPVFQCFCSQVTLQSERWSISSLNNLLYLCGFPLSLWSPIFFFVIFYLTNFKYSPVLILTKELIFISQFFCSQIRGLILYFEISGHLTMGIRHT